MKKPNVMEYAKGYNFQIVCHFDDSFDLNNT